MKKEIGYVIHTCSYSGCAVAVRVAYVIHLQRAYPHLACHRHCGYCFASPEWPEGTLIARNLKKGRGSWHIKKTKNQNGKHLNTRNAVQNLLVLQRKVGDD